MNEVRGKKYVLQLSPGLPGLEDFKAFEVYDGKEIEVGLIDEETLENFDCKVIISKIPQEGYHELTLQGISGDRIRGEWHVKLLDQVEEEDEEITVFRSAKLSERRGYMLRSMIEEHKTERKEDIMTTELEERKRKKKELTEEIFKKAKKQF